MTNLFKRPRVLGSVHVPYVPPKFSASRLGEKHRAARNKANKASRKSRRTNRRE